MTNFTIESIYNKEDFIDISKIKWKIHWLKNHKHISNLAITTAVFMILSILTITKEEPVNIYVILTIGFGLLMIFLTSIRRYARKNYFKTMLEISEKFESEQMDCIYEFSEDSIKYSDKEKKLEFKWSVLTNYSIYKDYLVLFVNNSIVDSFIFKKAPDHIADYEKIHELTKRKLEYKSVK
jgi:hypothetical protein